MEPLSEEAFTLQHQVITTKMGCAKDRLKLIYTVGKSAQKDASKLGKFNSMFKEAKFHYDSFLSYNDVNIELYGRAGKIGSYPIEADSQLAEAVDNYYYGSRSLFDELNPPVAPAAQQLSNTSVSFQPSTLNKPRLPKIHLVEFDGDFSKWPLFRDTFKSMVHNDADIPAIQKFHHLISALKGPPLALIKDIPVEGNEYGRAWKAMLDNYDNKRLLANFYLSKIWDFKAHSGKPTVSSLREFLSVISENIAAYKLLQITNSEDFLFFLLSIRCLDPHTRYEFERKNITTDFPEYTTLVDFVKQECRTLELSGVKSDSTNFNLKPSGVKHKEKGHRSSFFVNKPTKGFVDEGKTSNSGSHHCPVCKSQHGLYNCEQFKKFSPRERFNCLKRWSGCKNCLEPLHSTQRCPSSRVCKVCQKKHNTWLHLGDSSDTSESHSKNPETPPSSSNGSTVFFGQSDPSISVLLGTAMIKIKDSRGHLRSVRAVVDGGSELSFMTETCRNRLGLKLEPYNRPISGLGQSNLCETKGVVDCHIQSPSSQYSTCAVVVSDITGYLPHFSVPPAFNERLKGFLLADPMFNVPGPIDFLLGADLFYDILSGPPISVSDNMPKLIPTTFGHLVAGRCQRQATPRVFLTNQTQDLTELMSKFWTVENVGDEPITSSEDNICEDLYRNTTYRDEKGRYVVALPLKKPPLPDLSASKFVATKRFHNLESKLIKSPDMGKAYKDFMGEYLSLGHMEPANSSGRYFIPHHGVWKEDDKSKKIRVVFDGSCKTKNGSLNDHLFIGPKLQKDGCLIILRFRTYAVVFTADIVKMYRMILIRPEDRIYQHILWRDNPEDELLEMELLTVTYGLSPSPFLALRTVQQLVKDEGPHFPEAADALSNDIFVDDIASGRKNIPQALQLQDELISMLRRGGFELSKWSSNRPELLERVDSASTKPLHFDNEGESYVKILGLQWDPASDTFRYKITPPLVRYTKRSILSAIARIYDPLGYLSPVVFFAKVLLQACWQAAVSWDEPVPDSIAQHWSSFVEELPLLHQFKIPRLLDCESAHNYQMIGFCDASTKGYSAAIYIRLEFNSRVEVNLLKAKTGVAPIRPISIPRLELSAAVLLGRLYVSLKELALDLQVSEFYWFSDSTVVLGWLNTPPHLLKTYVGHRVVNITNKTDASDWYHVSSTDNPSDCSSRGILPSQLIDHPLWLHGPSWLHNHPSQWPISNEAPCDELPELKSCKPNNILSVMHQSSFFCEWMERYSSYGKILRIIHLRILRAMKHLVGWPNRNSPGRQTQRSPVLNNTRSSFEILQPDPIKVSEYHAANLVFIKIVQQRYIAYQHPKNGDYRHIPVFRKLNCFVDTHGIIRVGGRLENSTLPFEAKHPIILPGKCHFSQLLIDFVHRTFLHLSPAALQCKLHTQYWILSARTVHRCVVCFKVNKTATVNPKMGNLPISRVVAGGVFSHVGVDYAGPFLVRFSKNRKSSVTKAYLCLFVCMATKALHLELVSDCTTETFLATFDRFIGRRGLPEQIFSDCGKSFVGADRQLKEFHNWFKSSDVQQSVENHLAPLGIQWSFNPPYAPNFGGLWEAGVKSVKGILHKVTKNIIWTFEELSTIFIRIEAILNSRPLSPMTNDPQDLECLTPGHFLIGRPLIARPEPNCQETPMNRLRRWQLVQRQTQHFWQRWQREYLHHLQQRPKWTQDQPNLTSGTLVILREPNLPPTHWQLGRITQAFPGKDDIVRVIEVMTPSGKYIRKASQVVSLAPITDPDLPTIPTPQTP